MSASQTRRTFLAALSATGILFAAPIQACPVAPCDPPANLILSQAEQALDAPAKTSPKAKPPHSARSRTQKDTPNTQPARKPWQEELRSQLEACRELSFFKRGFCMDRAKFKHCYPDRWDTIPECASTHAPQRGAQ